MADPVTMGAVGIGTSILGGITSGIGSIMGGNSKSNMYQYQAGVARINADLKIKDAEYARTGGEREAQRVGMGTRFAVGKQKVAQSASGIDVNSGSAADVRESTGDLGRHDQATTRANAARRAYGFEVEAAQQKSQAKMYDKAASDAETAGYIGAIGSVLGGISSVAGKWTDASRLGMGGGRGISYNSPDFPAAEIDF